MKYEKLFQKGKIGRLELPNRVVMTAMGTMLGDWNGCSTPEQVRDVYKRQGLRFAGGHGTQMDGFSQAYLSGAEQARYMLLDMQKEGK